MTSLPIVDAGGASLDASPPASFVDSVRRASSSWGCFGLVGHGIPPSLVSRFEVCVRHFFALPREAKLAVERDAENARGYYDRELTKNRPDWKEVFDYGLRPGPDGEDRWPEGEPELRATLIEWQRACEEVAFRILGALAIGIELPARGLDAHFEEHTSFTRLNHYPRCPDPAPADAPLVPDSGAFGVSHHTDAGALTILWQGDVAGLQVFHDGAWVLVEPEPGSLVVNLGDMFQVWSNDRYRSPLHRVIADAEHERFSAPFFFNPSADAVCRPLSEPARYRPIPWSEFRRLRSAGDYADVGEEVQIARYRVGVAGPR